MTVEADEAGLNSEPRFVPLLLTRYTGGFPLVGTTFKAVSGLVKCRLSQWSHL
jgi:hypothetical protein